MSHASSVHYAIQFDPYEVLGIAPGASLSEIRDAFRSKSRHYHPDAGGDAWAFRVLNRSYELLSQARVMGRATEEEVRQPSRAQERPSAPQRDPAADAEGRLRSGAIDHDVPRARLADVELLLLRYEVDDPLELLNQDPGDRNLSCNLSVAWPAADTGATAQDAEAMFPALEKAVKAALGAARARSHKESRQGGRFVAWLSFATAVDADSAFRALRTSLKGQGSGVRQTIREVMIPREWNA